MKIKKPTNSFKKILLMVMLLAVLLLGGYTALAYNQQFWPFSTPNATVGTNESNSKADKPVSEATNNSDEDNPTANTPVKYSTPEGSNTPEDKLTGVINYKNVVDDKLTIRTTINQLVRGGECKLTLTTGDSGKTVTKTTGIIDNPSSSSCDGFSIPVSELSPGKWTISLVITSGDKQGTLRSTVDI